MVLKTTVVLHLLVLVRVAILRRRGLGLPVRVESEVRDVDGPEDKGEDEDLFAHIATGNEISMSSCFETWKGCRGRGPRG